MAKFGGDFSHHPIAPGESLLLLSVERGVPKGAGALELVAKDDIFRITVFGLSTDPDISAGSVETEADPAPLGRFMIDLELNQFRKAHPLELFLRKNQEEEQTVKPYRLMINRPRITGSIRCKTALEKGQEFRIEAMDDVSTVRLNVVDIAPDHIIMQFADEAEERILFSSDTCTHGLLICFVAYASNVGWFLWVANAKSVTLEDLPFTLRSTGTDLDLLMRTAQSLPMMRVVQENSTTPERK